VLFSRLLSVLEYLFHFFNDRNSFFPIGCINSFIRILYNCLSFYMVFKYFLMYFDEMTQFLLFLLFSFFLLLLNSLKPNYKISPLSINPFSYLSFLFLVLLL